MNDIELIEAHMSGDPRAFEGLVDAYIDRLFSFAYRLSGDASVAEDAVQDAFVKAWKGIDSFDVDRSFKSWIFSITRNATIDIMRKRRDVSFSSLDDGAGDDSSFADDVADETPLPEMAFDEGVDGGVVKIVLSGMGERDRSIVLLHDVEGMTFEQISVLVDSPMNTVKSRYRRALLKLRAELGGSREAMHQKPDLKRIP